MASYYVFTTPTLWRRLLPLILPTFLISAYYIWCIYSDAHETNFIMEANTVNPDQTAAIFRNSLIWEYRLPKNKLADKIANNKIYTVDHVYWFISLSHRDTFWRFCKQQTQIRQLWSELPDQVLLCLRMEIWYISDPTQVISLFYVPTQALKYLKIGTYHASQKSLAYMGKKLNFTRNIKIFTSPAAFTHKYKRTSVIFEPCNMKVYLYTYS